MLSLENIGIEFSGKWLLRQASYQFLPGERIGLIGRNGAGKSTLLRMIAGEMQPSEGDIHKSGKLKIAFFNQDLLSYQTESSILDVAREAFGDLLRTKAEIDDLLAIIEKDKASPEQWDRLASLQESFETRGGKQIDAQVHATLSGLGFAAEDHSRAFKTFSGGWRMRVLLAKMLLTQPDILLLDEPTNHLDLPSIQWLESYLKHFSGSCIVVSHDRFFIDRMSQKILEISLKKLHQYSGNYSYYEKEKALRQEQHVRAYENQQKLIEAEEKLINRFRYKASKAKQMQSRLKRLDQIDRIEAPEEERAQMKIRFQIQRASGKEVLKLRDIRKAYGPIEVLEGGSATVMRGDKIGLIGANGLGKSTLLRIMTGTEAHEGNCETGYHVHDAFFAQHQLEALSLQHTILEEISHHSKGRTETELRGILGCFMFSGDDVDKKIQVLSGGEKSRVALAKTLLTEANFLLLDEPTNHLDIQSIQVLVEALNAYEGSYVLVSHDRYFLEQVANKIWYIEDKQIKVYPGNYQEYDRWLQKRNRPASEPEEKEVTPKSSTLNDFQRNKQRKNRLRKLERMQAQIESEITKLEQESARLMEQMNDPETASNYEKLSETQAAYHNIETELEHKTQEWEAIIEELESLQN